MCGTTENVLRYIKPIIILHYLQVVQRDHLWGTRSVMTGELLRIILITIVNEELCLRQERTCFGSERLKALIL